MSPVKKVRHISQDLLKKENLYYQNLRKTDQSNPINLTLEEYEALRLYYYQKLSQSECAKEFSVSQPTFSRIINKSIEKLVTALVEERHFQISGGNVKYKEWKGWGCWACDNEWETSTNPTECPKCDSKKIFTVKKLVTKWEP